MTTTTTSGTRAQQLAYAWAASSPVARWSPRSLPDPAAGRSPVSAPYGTVAGAAGSLATLEPFRCHDLSAAWEHGTYVVRSFRTPILRVRGSGANRGVVELNVATYSPSTSVHQRVAAAWAGRSVPWVQDSLDGTRTGA